MGESISVAGMYFSYSFVYFMYGSFFMVAHATHQVSDSIILSLQKASMHTDFFFLNVGLFQVSERKYKSEE